jgi:hypothetical protein
VIANNLILEPRDYAQCLRNEGNPVASRIAFTHNLTDLPRESNIFMLDRNRSWHPVRDEDLTVVAGPVLRAPANRDFRLLPTALAVDGGIALTEEGRIDPDGGASYIGAFGPGSRWVEVADQQADALPARRRRDEGT